MMKYFALFFLIGFASASFVDVLEKTSNDVVDDFILGMENAPSLRSVLGAEYAEEADEIEDDIKTELGKTLRETLDQILNKIRDAVDHGREVKNELIEKAKEVTQKIKEIGLDAGSKAKDLAEKIKEKAKDWLRQLLEKIGLGKRSLRDIFSALIGQIDIRAILEKVKNKIAEKVNVEAITEYLRKLFGDSLVANLLIDLVKEKGIEALRGLIRRLLPGGSADYSIISTWESIKEYLRGLGVQLKEKAAKFADWLKQTVREGVEKAKDRAEQLKIIAKQTLENSKTLTKEAAREALEFFRPYKEDLGTLWDDLKDTVKRVIGRE